MVNLTSWNVSCITGMALTVMLTCSVWIRMATSTTPTWTGLVLVCAQYLFTLKIRTSLN